MKVIPAVVEMAQTPVTTLIPAMAAVMALIPAMVVVMEPIPAMEAVMALIPVMAAVMELIPVMVVVMEPIPAMVVVTALTPVAVMVGELIPAMGEGRAIPVLVVVIPVQVVIQAATEQADSVKKTLIYGYAKTASTAEPVKQILHAMEIRYSARQHVPLTN
jgi:hypothetical protein